MRLKHQAREGQITGVKETIRSLQSMLSDERDHWEQTRATLEAQCTEDLEAQKQVREGAVDTEAERAALEARSADAQRIIDSLITRVGKPPPKI